MQSTQIAGTIITRKHKSCEKGVLILLSEKRGKRNE